MPNHPLTAEPDRGPNILGLLADLGYAAWILGRTALRRTAEQHTTAVIDLAARRQPVGYLIAFRTVQGELTPIPEVLPTMPVALDALAMAQADDPATWWQLLTIRDDFQETP